MTYAITIEEGASRHYLIKSSSIDRVTAVARLCTLYLNAFLPDATAYMEAGDDLTYMPHPDKEILLLKLRAEESPLPPEHDILEGEYHRL